jgi:hypothetical protein
VSRDIIRNRVAGSVKFHVTLHPENICPHTCTVRAEMGQRQIFTFNIVPGGYKYGDLDLQVGGVSNETVKYGCEFCGTSTQE